MTEVVKPLPEEGSSIPESTPAEDAQARAEAMWPDEMVQGMWLMLIGVIILEPFLYLMWAANQANPTAIMNLSVNTILIFGRCLLSPLPLPSEIIPPPDLPFLSATGGCY